MLEALGYSITKYHMNEGHSALLTLELLSRMDAETVRRRCIFTTHTPIEAAFDHFPYDIVKKVLGRDFPVKTMQEYNGNEKLNMTLLAMNLSRYQNAVTKAHGKHSKKMFPYHVIRSVTNGVHSHTWTSEPFRKLFDKHIPGWAAEPELLVRIDRATCGEVWEAHMENKSALLKFVKEKTRVEMDESVLTIAFARRATGYKRATLIFSDLKRLREINNRGKLQLIFAGKAHPRDTSGKEEIKAIFKFAEKLKGEINVVYLENYDMDIAAKLTAGVDLWLNTPLPPMEASGTSGMKAAHNGVVNLSVLDGWWIEGCIEGVTGWAIGPSPDEAVTEDERRTRELEDLFNKLKYLIIPRFYEEKDSWIELMKSSIGKIVYYFNTDRMMRRYIADAYLT